MKNSLDEKRELRWRICWILKGHPSRVNTCLRATLFCYDRQLAANLVFCSLATLFKMQLIFKMQMQVGKRHFQLKLFTPLLGELPVKKIH